MNPTRHTLSPPLFSLWLFSPSTFLLFTLIVNPESQSTPLDHGLETEAASLTAPPSPPTLPIVADWTVKTDMLGEAGPSPLDWSKAWWLLLIAGLLLWQVAVEIAVASEMGIKQSPFPCKYCMAEPISSSINLATWCSVTVKLLSLVLAVWLPLEVRERDPPSALAWIQSPPAYRDREKKKSGNVVYDCFAFKEESEKKESTRAPFVLVVLLWLRGFWGLWIGLVGRWEALCIFHYMEN